MIDCKKKLLQHHRSHVCIVFISCVTLVSSHQACYNGLKYDVNSNNPHRWVLPYEDPCEYAAVLGVLTAPNVSYQQGAPYYLDKVVTRLRDFLGCQGTRLCNMIVTIVKKINSRIDLVKRTVANRK